MEYDLQHTGEKSLRIGTNLIVARSIFGELWNAYHLVCPDVQTKVSLEENEALLLKLQNFELDSVIIDRECNIPELVCREIADDEYFLICGTKSHFFNCKEARLADLKDENFFMLARGNPTRDYFEQSFHDHSFRAPYHRLQQHRYHQIEGHCQRGYFRHGKRAIQS